MTSTYIERTNIVTENYGVIEAISNPTIPQMIVAGMLLSFFLYKAVTP